MLKNEKEHLMTQLAKAWLWIVSILLICGYVLAWLYMPGIAIGFTIVLGVLIPAAITGWAIGQIVTSKAERKEKQK